jgi:hypothetical protein
MAFRSELGRLWQPAHCLHSQLRGQNLILCSCLVAWTAFAACIRGMQKTDKMPHPEIRILWWFLTDLARSSLLCWTCINLYEVSNTATKKDSASTHPGSTEPGSSDRDDTRNVVTYWGPWRLKNAVCLHAIPEHNGIQEAASESGNGSRAKDKAADESDSLIRKISSRLPVPGPGDQSCRAACTGRIVEASDTDEHAVTIALVCQVLGLAHGRPVSFSLGQPCHGPMNLMSHAYMGQLWLLKLSSPRNLTSFVVPISSFNLVDANLYFLLSRSRMLRSNIRAVTK